MSTPMRHLTRNALGQLTLTLDDGRTHTGIVPVRAYPLSAPDEGVSLMNTDSHEVAWIDLDNASIPGITGGGTAAPILFEAYHRSGLEPVPLPRSPKGATVLARADLPPSLQRYAPTTRKLVKLKAGDDAPEIVFPPNGARVELASNLAGEKLPLVLKLNGGKAPYLWLANGIPLPEASRRRTQRWAPDGAGYSELTVIDANGKAASVKLFVE